MSLLVSYIIYVKIELPFWDDNFFALALLSISHILVGQYRASIVFLLSPTLVILAKELIPSNIVSLNSPYFVILKY